MDNCPNCQHPIETGASFCTRCGHQLESVPPGRYEATGGQLPNRDIMQQAREALRGRWGLAIGTILVYNIIINAIAWIPYAGGIASLLIGGPMVVGLCVFQLSLSRRHDPKFEQIFHGFRKFGVALGAYLLRGIFVLLWTLLLIIPGIIAALSYSQTFYIIAESDSVGPLEAIRKSKQMMYGHRWKLFCLELRFIGWVLLCLLTLGIGFLWLWPYMGVSFARFYDDVAE